MANSKYAKASNQYLQKLLDTKDSVNIQRVVKRSVAILRDCLSSPFEDYHMSDFKDNLRRFFATIICKLGTSVKTSTLNSYKYGISAIVLKIGLDD